MAPPIELALAEQWQRGLAPVAGGSLDQPLWLVRTLTAVQRVYAARLAYLGAQNKTEWLMQNDAMAELLMDLEDERAGAGYYAVTLETPGAWGGWTEWSPAQPAGLVGEGSA